MPDHPLLDAFMREVERRSDARAPSDVHGATRRYGWSARDLARELGVSERTARRYRQQDRIPERRQEAWRDVTRKAARSRTADRIGRRGLSGMSALGRYRVSKSVYETHPDAPVRVQDGEHIPGAALRDVFDLANRGELGEAEDVLAGELGRAYGIGQDMGWERVDSLRFDIR